MKYKLEDISLNISKGSTPRGKVNYSSDENNLFLRVTDLSELQHIETAEYTLSDDDIKKNKMKYCIIHIRSVKKIVLNSFS